MLCAGGINARGRTDVSLARRRNVVYDATEWGPERVERRRKTSVAAGGGGGGSPSARRCAAAAVVRI